jgi:hypothetical protein
MDMIGHQDIGMDGDSVFSGGFAQAFQVEPVIVVCIEAGLTIVAALDNVLGDRRYTKPWETGHLQILLLY